jgi:hypothetical protein
MNSNLKKLAASAVLTVSTAISAFAGSVTEPGESVGLPTGAPLPPGFYFLDTTDWGVRSTSPNTALGVTIPALAWSTPWTLLGAGVQFVVVSPAAEEEVNHTTYFDGFFNPFFGGQLAWDLGGGFGFSYLIGGYPGVHTPMSFDTASLNQRVALSYTADGWNLTGNAIGGLQSQAVTATLILTSSTST